jgi:ATP-binding cassette subfamily B protein
MTDAPPDDAIAAGRPGAGAVLAASMAQSAQRRPKSRDLRPLAGLWPHVKAHWVDAAMAGLFLLISSSATLAITGAARYVIDHSAQVRSHAALNSGFVVAGLIIFLLAVATALRFFFVSRLGERIVADLRIQVYDHVLTLDPTFFLNTRTGEVLSRMTTDMTMIETVSAYGSMAIRNAIMFVGAFAMLIVVVPSYTIYVVVLAVGVLVPLFLYGRRVRRFSMQAQDKFADAVGFAGESLDALETVQAFGRETSVAARFARTVETAFRASMRRVRARAFMASLVICLVFTGLGGMFYLALSAVLIDHTMTAGVLAQFVLLAGMAAGAVGTLGEVMGEIQKAAGAMDRISEILHAQPGIAAPAHPIALPSPPRGAIGFEHVTFSYPGRPDLPALRDFTLTVKPGERVALVGPSGAGKSTVLRLLLRFYDPQSGVVRVDGVNLRDADPAAGRARMALVGQDAPLFSGSAYENIQFGREGATEDEMRAAAQAAQAMGFLSALPEGLNTPVGERAKTLSGGQRQRLAIARALVRNAPILLLDEATSALDAENEVLVQKALHEAMVGRTTLVIAHRLATVLKADRIVVMEDGHVVEEGVHADLVARGGLYARLAKLQFGVEAA